MIHLIYISSATRWLTDEELTQLLSQARVNNDKKNITGMLLYDNATFIQVLEGDEKDVHEVYHKIAQDPRNTGLVKLVEKTIETRDFPDWSMGFKNLQSCLSHPIPGFVDIFNGKLNKEIAKRNHVSVERLMKSFAVNI
ncbi:hypothetical protein PA25_36730 [Pseudoalteromonas sp. A25]|uniref:BLUF domain-containing protein n=1 Tax=Pseudoalteromonas sp. A25 TaxID=116092 RepID=UPI0012A1BACC|nr:BLUF domain-containing protein [Pseudoalteromonas sp. A25]BBN83688.1 hypothetical protein PA25_36730 [Pseudoalteromonas sp. A25]